MKGKRIFYAICMLTFFVVAVTGCKSQKEDVSEYSIYYLNKTNTKIQPVAYEPTSEKTETMIRDMLEKLSQNPDTVELKKTVGEQIEVLSWSLEKRHLQLNFSSAYSQMDPVNEVLRRAAVVRTLIQIEGVDSITFYVGDSPLTDSKGNPIGLMTAESFIENPGKQVNSVQTATITLYFPNRSGDALVQEVQECHYNSNISLEKLVIEQLMKGPKTVKGMSGIPDGTKLLNIYVLDGVCFVNFDEKFLVQNYNIGESIVIYSIVNSLAELSYVNKVQLSVNGDTNFNYREKFSLSTVYERNLDYLEERVEEQIKNKK